MANSGDETSGGWSKLTDGYRCSMRRWSEFSGRSDLSEFWSFVIVYLPLCFAAALIDAVISAAVGNFRGFRIVVSLVHVLPNLALISRRLHDMDRRAWWMFWPFVAVKGLYVQGTPGPNRFGPEPTRDPRPPST